MTLSIVEGTHYDHQVYGPVECVLFEDGEVYLQSLTESVTETDMPKNYKEDADSFREQATPRKRVINAPVTTLDMTGHSPGGL